MNEIEFLDSLHPNWRSGEVYTDSMFLKTSKDKTLKAVMCNLRVYYSKYSGKQSGCFCARGIRIIIEWLIKKQNLNNNENKNI